MKESIDTGKSLFIKQEEKSIELFKNILPRLYESKVPTIIVLNEIGTIRRHSELFELDEIDLDSTYVARDLLNILRARTFRPYESVYFIDDDGSKVFVRVELEYE